MSNEKFKCPHCGELIEYKEVKEHSDFDSLLAMVRNEEFSIELDNEIKKEKEKLALEFEVNKQKEANEVSLLKKELEQKIADVDNSIAQQVKAQIFESEMKFQQEKGNFDIEKKNFELQSRISKENWEAKEKEYKDQIEYWKDLKVKQSTKMLGETLEKHCEISFNKIRATAYPNAYFEKDNEVVGGSKGDYIFRNYDENGIEFCSIMFEMKNEADETATKHKNEDFFQKLDKDRNNKNCKYAVLVSTLEKDNELYNDGIVDVSYRYPNMYVVRPQLFLSILSILNNTAKETLKEKKEIVALQNKQLDIVEFDKQFDSWKNDVSKSLRFATQNRNKVVEKLLKTRDAIDEIIDVLGVEEKQLSTAERKAISMTTEKLAKNSPNLLLELKEEKET